MGSVTGHARALCPEVVALHERSALAVWLSATLAGLAEQGIAELPAVSRTGPMEKMVSHVRFQVEDCKVSGFRMVENERIRLFVNGPGGIPLPPYGSWWIDGKMMGASSIELADFYRKDGLRNKPGDGPVDFLPAELEFLHFLLQHQIAAFMTRQDDLAAHARSREKEFVERFLLPWIPKFCARGRESTENRFWLAVFDLLERFVESGTK